MVARALHDICIPIRERFYYANMLTDTVRSREKALAKSPRLQATRPTDVVVAMALMLYNVGKHLP